MRVGSASYNGSEYRDTACPECRNTAFRKYPDGVKAPLVLQYVRNIVKGRNLITKVHNTCGVIILNANPLTVPLTHLPRIVVSIAHCCPVIRLHEILPN